MNKKGDIVSIIFAVVAIFIIGILFFFMNHVTDTMYTSLDEYFNDSVKYNDSVAHESLERIHGVENSIWDYAFVGIFLGYMLALALTAFSTRISAVFYWIYGILSLVVLGLGVILSNIWQEAASQPTFSETILRFPITNAILGTYYPTFITGMIVIGMILLFGKSGGAEA